MKKLFLLSLTILLTHTTLAKTQSPFRTFLNHIHISFATGYGITYYTNQVNSSSGCTMYREGSHLYIVHKATNHNQKTGLVYQVRWFDGPYILMKSDTDTDLLPAKHTAVGGVKFTGQGKTIPLVLSGYLDTWGKLRLGIGGALFINTLESLQFQKQEKSKQDLGNYIPVHQTHYRVRPFGIVGYKFMENVYLSMLLDVNIGFDFAYAKLGDPKCIDRFLKGVYNIGLTLEKHISEYFRIHGRLFYERSDTIDALTKDKLGVVLERSNISLQLGLSFNYAELPRCPVPNCKIELKHKHAGQHYRGVPIYRGKNLQGERLYKK